MRVSKVEDCLCTNTDLVEQKLKEREETLQQSKWTSWVVCKAHTSVDACAAPPVSGRAPTVGALPEVPGGPRLWARSGAMLEPFWLKHFWLKPLPAAGCRFVFRPPAPIHSANSYRLPLLAANIM